MITILPLYKGESKMHSSNRQYKKCLKHSDHYLIRFLLFLFQYLTSITEKNISISNRLSKQIVLVCIVCLFNIYKSQNFNSYCLKNIGKSRHFFNLITSMKLMFNIVLVLLCQFLLNAILSFKTLRLTDFLNYFHHLLT